MEKLTIEQRDSLPGLYRLGSSCTELAKQFGIGKSGIRHNLKKRGVIFRLKTETHRKYPLDEDFFNEVDNEEKAYFLGLLYADGCNRTGKTRRCVKLALNEKDIELVEKFQKCLKTTKPVVIRKPGKIGKANLAVLEINSIKISDRLNELGCGPVKSFTLSFPEWLNIDLHAHFIRGYLDGDGGIDFYKEKLGNKKLRMIGTPDFIDSVRQIIFNKFNYKATVYSHLNKKLNYLAISSYPSILAVGSWLYNGATIYLNRKHDKFLEIEDYYNTKLTC